MSRRRGSKAVERALAFAFGSCALVLVLELALRSFAWASAGGAAPPPDQRIHDFAFFDTRGVPRFEAHARGWHRGYGDAADNLVVLNSLGLPGPEPRDGAAPRIAFLGDSIVFNGGLPFEQSFVARSAEVLRDAGYRDAEVLNFGFSDGNLEHYEAKLEHEVLPLAPDLVYLGLYLNDSIGIEGSPVAIFADELPQRQARGAHPSYLVQRLRRLWLRARASDTLPAPKRPERRAITPERFAWVSHFEAERWKDDPDELQELIRLARNDWGAAWTRAHWDHVDAALKRMARSARDAGSEFVLVLFPASPQVEARVSFDGLSTPQRAAFSVADRHFIYAIDLIPALRAAEGPSLFHDQCHLSVRGNAIVGELIGRDMLRRWAPTHPIPDGDPGR